MTRALAGPLVKARATSAAVAPWAPTPGSSRTARGSSLRASATTGPGTTGATTTNQAGAEFYVIQAGDTLAVIADDHDTTVEQLLVLNPDVDPVALTVGQRIRVK